MSKRGSERLRSRTEIQVEEEELQKQRTRFGQRKSPLEEQQVQEMYGKDIRNSEEVKSQKQKQSQYQKNMDENNETFKHDTELHKFRTACAAGADLQPCEDDHRGDPELTMTIRKSVIINEYESDQINPQFSR